MIGRIASVVLFTLLVGQVSAQRTPDARPLPRIPSVEQRAPHFFSSAAPAVKPLVDATYRMDAQVLVPLWMTSVRIASSRDVGMARVTMWEEASERGSMARAFQFFARSIPERARGVERVGLFREVDEYVDRAAVGAAYFGVMSRGSDRGPEEATQASNAGTAGLSFDSIDGMAAPREATASRYRLRRVSEDRASAELLYAGVREALSREPRSTQRLDGSTVTIPSQSFLGALHANLIEAAAMPLPPVRRTYPSRTVFVYNGELHALDVTAAEQTPAIGQSFATAGLAGKADAVYRLDYRLSRVGGPTGAEFSVWVELGTPSRAAAAAAPVLPLAFELQPRSFLRLHFDRIR